MSPGARTLLAGVILLCGAASVRAETMVATPSWVVGWTPSGEELSLEVADEPEERRVGYMHRAEVGPNEGMLFVFDAPGRHSIWMRNCLVSLDVLWLDAELRVVDRRLGASPCPEDGACPSMLPSRPARYVLELAAGRAEALGLDLGETLVLIEDVAP